MNLFPEETGNQVDPAPADLNGRTGRTGTFRTVFQDMGDPVELSAFDTDLFQAIGDGVQHIESAAGGGIDINYLGLDSGDLFHDFYSFFSNDMKYGPI